MKTITGKILILIALILLSAVPMRQTSAQFTCDTGGGGGNPDPTPTPTPECYYEYGTWTEAYCDYIAGFCCQDTYFVTYYYCLGVLISIETVLIDHWCYEI